VNNRTKSEKLLQLKHRRNFNVKRFPIHAPRNSLLTAFSWGDKKKGNKSDSGWIR
jgi:hypothetical protein